MFMVLMAPAATAGGPAPVGPGLLLYLDTKGYTTTAPASDKILTKTWLASSGPVPFTSPGASYSYDWNEIKMAQAGVLGGDATVSLYIGVSQQSAVLNSVQVDLYKGATIVASGSNNYGTGAKTIAAGTWVHATLGVNMAKAEFKAGDAFHLRITLFGVSTGETSAGSQSVVDFLIGYGSTKAPSAVWLPGLSASEAPLSLVNLYLDSPAAMSDVVPTGTADKKVEDCGPAAQCTPATTAEVAFGGYTFAEDLTFGTDTSITWWASAGANGQSAGRGVAANLYINDKMIGDRGGNSASGTEYTATAKRYDFGFQTAGMAVKAGDKLRLTLLAWGADYSTYTEILFLYGSAAHPSGISFGVAGAAAPTAISLGTAEGTQSAQPGQTASYGLVVQNLGSSPKDVALSAPNVSAAFEGGANVTVPAGSNATVNLTVAVPPDAPAGDQLFSVIAAVGGTSVANLSLVLKVLPKESVAPSGSNQGGGGGGSGATGGSGGNSTADNSTAGTGDGKKATPGFEVAALAVAAVLAITVSRRRLR